MSTTPSTPVRGSGRTTPAASRSATPARSTPGPGFPNGTPLQQPDEDDSKEIGPSGNVKRQRLKKDKADAKEKAKERDDVLENTRFRQLAKPGSKGWTSESQRLKNLAANAMEGNDETAHSNERDTRGTLVDADAGEIDKSLIDDEIVDLKKRRSDAIIARQMEKKHIMRKRRHKDKGLTLTKRSSKTTDETWTEAESDEE